MKNRSRFLIIILSALLITAAAAIILKKPPADGIANIYQDGVLVRSIEFSSVSKAYKFTVEYNGGRNTVLVERGSICVTQADCPDGLCIKQGKRPGGIGPIVCLPHRLVIEVSDSRTDTD